MYHFDAERVQAIVQGISLSEFGTGEFLTLTPRNKPFTEVEGTHGAIMRTRVPSNSYDLKVSILKGSPINQQISEKVRLDMIDGLHTGVLLIKDLEGTTLVSAEISYFYPLEIKMSTEPLVNEWNGFASIPRANWLEGSNRFLVPA